MAKGEGFGDYQLEEIISTDPAEITAWAVRELRKVQAALEAGHAKKIHFYHVEPSKPREGDVVGADGTDWNPGAGAGVYCYYNSAWNRLG